VVVDAPRLPALDETLVGSAVAYRFGGKGGNQAVAAARMGARAAMAGRVGEDRFGEQILAALDAAGVDRTRVVRAPGASGMSVAIVDAAGDYGAVIVSGVNREIDPAEALPPAGARVIALQNEIDAAVNRAVLEAAPHAATVVLNAAPARPIPPEMLARVDLLVVNRVEAAAMAPGLAPAEAAAALQAAGARAVIVTLGGDGLILRDGGGSVTLPAHRVPVVSTHGAGDMFVGALCAELARGAGLAAAARFGQAAAALAISRPPEAREALTEDAVRRLSAQSGG
jgi:ribokinase